jgi:hypothetical protein
MTTARDFCTLVLKEAGVTGVGQTPLPEDINDTFTLLKRMFAQWQKKRWLVPSLYEIAAQGNNQQFNLIGPGQYYNATRPDKVQAAYFLQIEGGAFDSGFSPGFDTGSSGNVSFPLIPIWSWEDYCNVALKQLNSWPQYFFYDGGFPYGRVYIWPIPSAQYEIHLILKSPIGFTIEIEDGEIQSQGAAYTDGVYNNVPLLNLTGFGAGAQANVTIAAGAITVLEIVNPGQGYVINDKLTVPLASVGGTGSGFIWAVTKVTQDLDSEFNMPPEYEEAIHYNLTRRVMEMYNYEVPASKAALARASLNVIKVANAQIPTLQMPRSLRNIRGNNFYIFNADAR